MPGKASNAGGVACSGLEMSQNAMRLHWTAGEVDTKLHGIMQSTTPASPTARKTVGSTTSKAPTSPASSRSPTPCWPRASSKAATSLELQATRRAPAGIVRQGLSLKAIRTANRGCEATFKRAAWTGHVQNRGRLRVDGFGHPPYSFKPPGDAAALAYHRRPASGPRSGYQ